MWPYIAVAVLVFLIAVVILCWRDLTCKVWRDLYDREEEGE